MPFLPPNQQRQSTEGSWWPATTRPVTLSVEWAADQRRQGKRLRAKNRKKWDWPWPDCIGKSVARNRTKRSTPVPERVRGNTESKYKLVIVHMDMDV